MTALVGLQTATAAPISYRDLLARPRATPTETIAYGASPLQVGELWLPEGPGPHPVVVMIHGGCWLAALPGTELMVYLAEDLRKSGVAVWNLEYRRIGHDGGGYPGTFLDIAHGIDHLKTIAEAKHLDLGRMVITGHSAGGHLAVWGAARAQIPATSPLYVAEPLPFKAVVSLAGINDLDAYRATGGNACGGPETIDSLVDATGRKGQDLYRDTSPAALLPIKVPQTIVSGDLDPIVPARFGTAYAERVKAAGDPVTVLDMVASGHFELIDPQSAAWVAIKQALLAPLK